MVRLISTHVKKLRVVPLDLVERSARQVGMIEGCFICVPDERVQLPEQCGFPPGQRRSLQTTVGFIHWLYLLPHMDQSSFFLGGGFSDSNGTKVDQLVALFRDPFWARNGIPGSPPFEPPKRPSNYPEQKVSHPTILGQEPISNLRVQCFARSPRMIIEPAAGSLLLPEKDQLRHVA